MKKLFILRGVPGCGKSTVAEAIKSLNEQVIHLEADQFFITKDGTYQFDSKKLNEAHAWCMEKFKQAIANNYDIILSNTSTRLWEFENYKKIAENAGYQVYCLIVENRHDGKNIHGVSEEKIEQMKKRFEVKL